MQVIPSDYIATRAANGCIVLCSCGQNPHDRLLGDMKLYDEDVVKTFHLPGKVVRKAKVSQGGYHK
jgi:hypothetical protein